MKLSIVFFFVLVSSFPAFCQTGTLQEGNKCFDSGDYACAITKYEEALRSVNGRDKQIAEINLGRARTCSDWLKMANQYFVQGNYKLAKDNYQNLINENPNDNYAKSQLEKCDILLKPKTTLTVSSTFFSFSSESGTQIITVNTNADSFSINSLPSWCKVQKNNNHFILTYNSNSESVERRASIIVTADDKVVEIEIKQAPPQPIKTSVQKPIQKTKKTSLSVSRKEYTFLASSGESSPIFVYTTAKEYLATTTSPWLSVKSYAGYLIISSKRNNASDSRMGVINVKTDDANVSIKVFQEGTKNSAKLPKPYNSSIKKNCFNCPQTKDPWGLTVGYNQMAFDPFEEVEIASSSYLNGIKLGLRFDPLFKGGFGLNTGFFLEGYFHDSSLSSNHNSKLGFYSFAVPLHLEYRLNLSKLFNLFAFGGPTFNYFTDSDFEQDALPATLDYGAGFRMNKIQFNFGNSLYMGSFRDMSNIGDDYYTYHNFTLNLSYMF